MKRTTGAERLDRRAAAEAEATHWKRLGMTPPPGSVTFEDPSDRTMRELRETPGTHPAPCWFPHSTDCTCDKGGAR